MSEKGLLLVPHHISWPHLLPDFHRVSLRHSAVIIAPSWGLDLTDREFCYATALPMQELDDKDTWYRLGVEALRQGNHQIVEFSYQKTKAYERESVL